MLNTAETPCKQLTKPRSRNEDVCQIVIGYSYRQRVIVVVHSDRDDAVRLISAREATAAERRLYEQEAH